MIAVEKIRKRYGRIEALGEVSLHVRRGELFGLIGPDGAGKSTLFRILTTLMVPDGGTARVAGFDCVADYRNVRCQVGYMPGKFSLYQDLTVEENIDFFASIFNVRKEDGLKLVEPIYRQIEPFKKRYAGKLSGGMKQKLALCCALIHKPEVLLLDEPTTGVDAVSRQEFWDMLGDLRRQGITILVSTPYMDEAMKCDRIALINEGLIMDTGVPGELVAKYGLPTIEQVFIALMSDGKMPVDIRRSIKPDSHCVIEVDNLVKRFGDFTAVDNISFKVRRGEIFGFLGANGAGKTTAMRMLCGLSFPTEGSGRVAGYDIMRDAEQINRSIGYMSQKFSLYDDLTVWENIEFYGGIYGLKGKTLKERGAEILENLRFTGSKNSLVGDLPLGWKQKLAFSIAMLHKPEVVFLDEPTGGVDPVVRRQFWQMIYEAAERGTTIFVTTHYMDEAEYCHMVSIMVDGKIEALDSPENLCKKYNATTMDEVFRILARGAKRSE